MKKILITLTILFAGLFNATGQTVLEASLKSEILACNKNYCIYLPAGYESSDTLYPVLYLLHGLTDNNKSWRDKGNVNEIATKIFAQGEVQKMIIVMPDAGTTYDGYFNCEEWK